MSTNVLRTADGWWVIRGDRAVPVDTKAVTTAELIADRDAVREAALSGEAGTPVMRPGRALARHHALPGGRPDGQLPQPRP